MLQAKKRKLVKMVRCIAEGYCWYCWMNLDKALQKIIVEGNIKFFVSTFVDLQEEEKKKEKDFNKTEKELVFHLFDSVSMFAQVNFTLMYYLRTISLCTYKTKKERKRTTSCYYYTKRK